MKKVDVGSDLEMTKLNDSQNGSSLFPFIAETKHFTQDTTPSNQPNLMTFNIEERIEESK